MTRVSAEGCDLYVIYPSHYETKGWNCMRGCTHYPSSIALTTQHGVGLDRHHRLARNLRGRAELAGVGSRVSAEAAWAPRPRLKIFVHPFKAPAHVVVSNDGLNGACAQIAARGFGIDGLLARQFGRRWQREPSGGLDVSVGDSCGAQRRVGPQCMRGDPAPGPDRRGSAIPRQKPHSISTGRRLLSPICGRANRSRGRRSSGNTEGRQHRSHIWK